MRLNRYCKASLALGLETILILDGCKGLNASFAECIGDGSCPECNKFSDGMEPLVLESAVTLAETTSTATDNVSNATSVPNPSPAPEPVETKKEQTELPSLTNSVQTDTSPSDTENVSNATPDPNPSPMPETVETKEEQTELPSSTNAAQTDSSPTDAEMFPMLLQIQIPSHHLSLSRPRKNKQSHPHQLLQH
jgi:hypothetical protein